MEQLICGSGGTRGSSAPLVLVADGSLGALPYTLARAGKMVAEERVPQKKKDVGTHLAVWQPWGAGSVSCSAAWRCRVPAHSVVCDVRVPTGCSDACVRVRALLMYRHVTRT